MFCNVIKTGKRKKFISHKTCIDGRLRYMIIYNVLKRPIYKTMGNACIDERLMVI